MQIDTFELKARNEKHEQIILNTFRENTRSTWSAKAFSESALPKAVKIHLASTLKSVPRSRLLLIKQSRKVKGTLTLFVVRSREASSSILRYEFSEYEQLLDSDLGSVLDGGSLAGATQWDGPLFLVCTHGKRDKCCAKFGIPVYKTIRTLVGDSAVWQCSHVGGDRFAANVVCFPDGRIPHHPRLRALKGAYELF